MNSKNNLKKLNLKNNIFFCVSDIHGFAYPLKHSLERAGFDSKNPNHILVVLGDIFDRGEEAVQVYNFIKRIPKHRRVLVKGNHEILFLQLLHKPFPESHDFHNKTVDTFCQFAKKSPELLSIVTYDFDEPLYEKMSKEAWIDIKTAVENHSISKWLQSDEWLDYAEVEKFIFVHSFIPVDIKQELIDKIGIYAYGNQNPDNFVYDPEWRKSNSKIWEDATWGCPWAQYHAGLFKAEEDAGKTLVCGHWHTSDFYLHLKGLRGTGTEIYYSKGLIGIDGGVEYHWWGGYSHHQNVLVIKDGVCYDEYGLPLMEVQEKYTIETEPAEIDPISGSD